VVDIKNTLEGNKSYAAEVVLYAIVLSTWLREHKLESNFFVSDECFLWTNRENAALAGIGPGASVSAKLDALLSGLEPIVFPVVAPAVIKFFKEDLPRVVSHGTNSGWATIGYHVGPKCSNCDWLGFDRWLSAKDKVIFNANKNWYCQPAASATGHLSMMPALSKGAAQVLQSHGVTDITSVAALPSGSVSLEGHSLLKRDRSSIPARAAAIISQTTSISTGSVLAGLASVVDMQVSIAVNFDSAAGLLTGIAARGTIFMPYGTTPPVQSAGDFASPVSDEDLSAEWNVLFAFLTTLENFIKRARSLLGRWPKTQLIFWEQRQFEELCAAVGRHLPRVFAPIKAGQPGDLVQALGWLFPPEVLIEKDGAVSPYIVFLGDLAQRVTRTPIPHAFTLRAAHEHYHHPNMQPRPLDSYFVDGLGNGIPRERIFEIWKNTGTIRRGATVITKLQAGADYEKALKAQSHAIASIAARLRQDFKGHLKGSAKQLQPTVLSGAQGVAFDSKLWLQWSRVEAATALAERKAEFTLPAETLEASYTALILTNRTAAVSASRGIYDVAKGSSEAKLDDAGAYFVVGSVNQPGFLLETPKSLGLPFHGSYGDSYNMPLYSILRATIHSLDRRKRIADVELLPRSGYHANVVNGLIVSNLLPTSGGMYLMDGKPYDGTDTVEAILREIGNPPTALADPAAVAAMGKVKAPTPGKSAPTAPARVLWEADKLAQAKTRSTTSAKKLSTRAKALVNGKLDPSQETAIEEVSSRQLSLIWGPPGTGKTSTLIAYLLAVIEEAISLGRPRRILLTGPNYRAVEVLFHGLFAALNAAPALPANLYMMYSRSRNPVPLPGQPAAHLSADALSIGMQDAAIVAAFSGPGVCIVGTSVHTVPTFVRDVLGANQNVNPIFDLCVIDESSQVPLNLALSPLAAITTDAEVVIAGDPMQMPPIQSLPPPVGAEHLVGSIHSYILKRFSSVKQSELLINYRSGQQLVDFARTLGYPPMLQAHTKDRRIQLVNSPASQTLPAQLPSSPAWSELLDPTKVVTALLHDDPHSSQANPAEAKFVAALVFLLRQCASKDLALGAKADVFPSDEDFFRLGVGIVTPHRAQRALIIGELASLYPSVPDDVLQECVDTVERFQGGERHTIIVSFGIGDIDVIQGEEEFLLQLERANVAISRAMGKCIVIMPRTLAYHLPSDNRVARTAVALKSYVEEFCSMRTTYTLTGGKTAEVRWH
jgi:hypothetical protein